MRPVNIGALILAAGLSRRLGRPKQDVILGGETLLHRAVRMATEAGLSPVIAVVRDPRSAEALHALKPTILLNKQSQEGMATSVVLGVTSAQQQGLDGLVMMTCDQPAVRPHHLQALCADPQRITGSSYAGRTGVPAYFPAAAFGELLHLQGDAGARHLLQHAASIADESLDLDIDTEGDLLKARRLLNI